MKDVDHAATSRFARGPETSVVIKVEDQLRVRTKTTRNDKWGLEESHDLEVDKANEIEIIVSDKPGDHVLPIGLLWVRLSDIAEEMRRKKIEQEIAGSGWVRAENMGNNQEGPTSPTNFAFPGPPPNSGSGMFATASGGRTVAQAAPQGDGSGHDSVIDAWFALEPVGQIRLQLSFGELSPSTNYDILLTRRSEIQQEAEIGTWSRSSRCRPPAERRDSRKVWAQVCSTAVLQYYALCSLRRLFEILRRISVHRLQIHLPQEMLSESRH